MTLWKSFIENQDNPSQIADVMTQYPSFKEFLDSLGDPYFLSKDVLDPLSSISYICKRPFSDFSRKCLNDLMYKLINCIKQNESLAFSILLEIHNLIHLKELTPLFACITESLPSLPLDFLTKIYELPLKSFNDMFTSKESKIAIYFQSKPIFTKHFMTIIGNFLLKPYNIDYFANVKKRRETCHSVKCGKTVEELISLASDFQYFYDEICSLLFDMYQQTKNPLLCAIRLQLAYKASNVETLVDKMADFTESISNFIINIRGMINVTNITAEARFISYDIVFRHCLITYFRTKLYEIIKKGGTELPINNREIINNSRVLFPKASREEIEDLMNNLCALDLAERLQSSMFSDIKDEILEFVAKYEEAGPVVAIVYFKLIGRSVDIENFVMEVMDNMAEGDILLVHKILVPKITAQGRNSTPNDIKLNKFSDQERVLKNILRWSLKNASILQMYLSFLLIEVHNKRYERIIRESIKYIDENIGNNSDQISTAIFNALCSRLP